MLNAITLIGLYLAPTGSKNVPGGEHIEETPFPPFDPTYFPSQIFWLLVSFFILYFLLSKIFLPKLSWAIEERSAKISDDIENAERMQRLAQDAETSYTESLALARTKSNRVAETTRQAVDAELKLEMDTENKKASIKAKAAEDHIKSIRNNAMKNLEIVASDVAQTAVESLTGSKVKIAEVKKAIKEG
jgi:F-type H+-transporting ATPase subunit b